VTLDGSVTSDAAIALVDDRLPHTAEVRVQAGQQKIAPGALTQTVDLNGARVTGPVTV